MEQDHGVWDGLEEHYADLSTGVRLHYVTQGSGPLVVLVHGFPEHWYGWRHMIPKLVDAGYRVVAPDTRGANLSSKPEPVEAYFAEILGDDIAALLDALNEPSAIVVGHDWGGVAAWFFAMRHPDKLERLVVMNMPHPAVFAHAWSTLRQKIRSAYFYFFRFRGFAAFFYRRFFALPQRLMLWFFAGRKPAWRELDPYARAGLRKGSMRAMMSYYTALLGRDPQVTLDLVQKIDADVRVLWGTKDPAFAEAMSDPGEYVNRDRLRVELLSGLGHFLHGQDPERVGEALLRALRDPSKKE